MQAWEQLSVVVLALPPSDRYVPPTGFTLALLPLHPFPPTFVVPGLMLVTWAFIPMPLARPDTWDRSQSTLGRPINWTGDPVLQVRYSCLFQCKTEVDANTTISQGSVTQASLGSLESPDLAPHHIPGRSLLLPPVSLNALTRSSFSLAKTLSGMFPFNSCETDVVIDSNRPVPAAIGRMVGI